MMFSDKNLVNSETFGDVWKLAHDISIENIEKTDLRNIWYVCINYVVVVPT